MSQTIRSLILIATVAIFSAVFIFVLSATLSAEVVASAPDQGRVIFEEDFEGVWPSAGWNIFSWYNPKNPQPTDHYLWSNRCPGFNGGKSAWPIGDGLRGMRRSCFPINDLDYYPNNIVSWATYGPIDLSGVTAAEIRLDAWINTEECPGGDCDIKGDSLFIGIKSDTEYVWGYLFFGNLIQSQWADEKGWVQIALPLDESFKLGQSNMEFGLYFESDDSVNYPGGVFVDNISIVEVLPTPTPSPTRRATNIPIRTSTSRVDPTRTRIPIVTSTQTPKPQIFLPIMIREYRCPPKDIFAEIIFVIDSSTSMEDLTENGRRKLDVAVEAATSFVEDGRLRMHSGGERIGIVIFNQEARLLQPLTSDRDLIVRSLRSITTTSTQSRIDSGLNKAYELLRSPGVRPANRGVILLTDGISNPVPGEIAIQAANQIRSDGILLYTVGFGPEMDQPTLSGIAAKPERLFIAPTIEEIGPIFVALVIKVQCPPEVYWGGR